jgi:hypothetical protein
MPSRFSPAEQADFVDGLPVVVWGSWTRSRHLVRYT